MDGTGFVDLPEATDVSASRPLVRPGERSVTRVKSIWIVYSSRLPNSPWKAQPSDWDRQLLSGWVRTLGASGGLMRIILLASIWGCEARVPVEDGISSFVQLDSADAVISVTPGVQARTHLDWEVGLTPDFVLGTADSLDYLYDIQGLRGLPDGGVVVAASGIQELHFYDSQGRLVKRVGRKGEGPGEFTEPVLVPTVGFDSLVVFAKWLRRFEVYSMDGDHARTLRPTKGWPWGGRPPNGNIGLRWAFRMEGETAEPLEAPLEGVTRIAFDCVWYDVDTGQETVADSFPLRALYWEGRWELPFTVWPQVATSADGAFVASGVDSEIREYDVEARLRRVFRIAEPRPRVTDGMLEDLAEAMVKRSVHTRAEWLAIWAKGPIPRFVPAFDALQVDELGWLWAKVYGRDPTVPQEWMVFDLEGRARGLVRTPPGVEIGWIGVDRILGTWRDDLRVEHVSQYRLRRDPGSRAERREGEHPRDHLETTMIYSDQGGYSP